jgi:hypothetical protein
MFFFSSTVNSQTITFNKRVLYGCTNNTIFTGIQVTDSCYYIMGNAREATSCNFGTIFLKLDTFGNDLAYQIAPYLETWQNAFVKDNMRGFANVGYSYDSIGMKGGGYKYTEQGQRQLVETYYNPNNRGNILSPIDLVVLPDSSYFTIATVGDTIRANGGADTYLVK